MSDLSTLQQREQALAALVAARGNTDVARYELVHNEGKPEWPEKLKAYRRAVEAEEQAHAEWRSTYWIC